MTAKPKTKLMRLMTTRSMRVNFSPLASCFVSLSNLPTILVMLPDKRRGVFDAHVLPSIRGDGKDRITRAHTKAVASKRLLALMNFHRRAMLFAPLPQYRRCCR